jgi:hypothetical protein
MPENEQLDEPQPNFTGSAHDMRRLVAEIAKRKSEGIRLYRPMPRQDAFHRSFAKERILIAGNRGGKTICAASEVARALLRCDPYKKYGDQPMVWYLVGKSSKEVGQVMYKYLFKPGAYRIIRDQETNEWRTFRPQDPADVARRHLSRPSLPLIPHRAYDMGRISWESKKDLLPKFVPLHNGSEIHFFTANGLPPQGTRIDGAWFTEEIPQRDWYIEIAARLIDNNGWFIWDGTPQVGTEQFHRLHERAEEQIEKNIQPRTVEEFQLSTTGNVYGNQEALALFKDKLEEDDYDIRVEGEFAFASGKIYPEYSSILHEEPYREIPAHWTRYIAIDPGWQIAAALFLAVPPPDEDPGLWAYDEIYAKDCTAVQFGKEMKTRARDQEIYQILIDWQHARKHEMIGKTIAEQYSEQLMVQQVHSTLTGYEFTIANSNVMSGIEAVKFWLRSHGQKPRLRVLRDKCPNLVWEFKHYQKKRVQGIILDEPNSKRRTHLMDCARYLAHADPQYIQPKRPKQKPSSAYSNFLKKQKNSDRNGVPVLMLGPHGAKI